MVKRLAKVDFQSIIDKAAGKLSAWNGCNLTQAGRVNLTKCVLSSQPVYFLTSLKVNKEWLDDLNCGSAFSGLVTNNILEASAKITGLVPAYRRRMGDWASRTSTSLQEHSGFGGFGTVRNQMLIA
jgi:hypothetical protein